MSTVPGRIHLYSLEWLPDPRGGGPTVGLFSDVRAYRDLGWTVEVVLFTQTPDNAALDPSLTDVGFTVVPLPPTRESSVDAIGRLEYRCGRMTRRALDYRYKGIALVRRAVAERAAADGQAVHHFQYVGTAAASLHLPDVRKTIWRMPDIESHFVREHHRMREEIKGSRTGISERYALNVLERTERKLSRSSALVLCYARHETEILRQGWGCQRAEFLPISWPCEPPASARHRWMPDGVLRLLHVGRVDSLSSFRSLQFILQDVLPRLDPDTLKHIAIDVIGDVRETARTRTILELAASFPQVRFRGYQPAIRDCYAQADLQLVGSSAATGLRTRIIESMAYGVPVLSSRVGAAGLDGMRDGENVLLADDASAFASQIERAVRVPASLGRLAEEGRRTYRELYSRQAIAARLDELLASHRL